MKVKMFEIRDRMTFIPVMCVYPDSSEELEGNWLLRKAGINAISSKAPIIIISFSKNKIKRYSHEWGDRTYTVAHKYIEDHWEELQDGDVIDVEFILGETKEKKISERFTC